MSLRVLLAKKKAAGFTLIELVLTIVILGFSAVIIIPFFSAITHSPDPVLREKAIALGQAMMDEIMAKKWDENSPVGGGPLNTSESTRGTIMPAPVLGKDGTETRPDYDDVDDYLDIPLEQDNFMDQNGNIFTLPGYTRQVAVDYIASSSLSITHNLPLASVNPTDTKRVVVTVTSPLGETFYFVAVVCNI